MKNIILFTCLFLSLKSFSQVTGQFCQADVSINNTDVNFNLSWWEIDPPKECILFYRELGFSFEIGCLDTIYESTGEGFCSVLDLNPNMYEYYFKISDGDQLIDSTSVGSFTVYIPISVEDLGFLYNKKMEVYNALGELLFVGKYQEFFIKYNKRSQTLFFVLKEEYSYYSKKIIVSY